MGKVTGFLEFERVKETYEAPLLRLKHWNEFVHTLTDDEAKQQGARCMDCGIPFCTSGCPVNNRSEEHTSELQSLMRISYAVFCLKKKNQNTTQLTQHTHNHQYTK